ncbi:MAG TPA: hypothetical protein VNS19_14590 [Acidimicrobiales bacterium]|nr:hypothetical protein [Acidimicrobiales bacterium]
MAILHRATLTPTKPEALGAWVPHQPWSPGPGDVELVGAFRFDDPDGRVGLEVHLVRLGGVLLQVPLTYRDAPLPGAEDHLVTTMVHTALGDRWVYDGLADPVFVSTLAAAALTGTGQAVGIVEDPADDGGPGRRFVVPSPIKLAGGGWTGGPVAVDRFDLVADAAEGADLRSDRFELRVARRPEPGPVPAIGLTATVPGDPDPVVLVEVSPVA